MKPSIETLVNDDRDQGLFRVHRSSMVSQEILDLERELIFERCWLYVGHESEIPKPGDYKRRSVGGKPIIFIRGADGHVRALFNACTHRGATICRQDTGNARIFQCFYHAWTFDTTGALVQIPDEAGYSECFDRADRGLRAPAQFASYGGLYFLCYSPDTEPLEDYLAGAKEFIDLVNDQSPDGMQVTRGTNLYSTGANWKLLVENSADGYHGVPVHSTYLDYVASYGEGMQPSVMKTDAAWDLGNGHAAIELPTVSGRPVAHWHPLFGEETKPEIERIEAEVKSRVGEERGDRICHSIRLLLVFPNFAIVDSSAVTLRTFEPVTEEQINISAWSLGPKGEAAEALARRTDSYVTFFGPAGFATPDDAEALESCQQGFKTWREQEWSDISRGMTRMATAMDELQMRTFWRTWQSRIAGKGPAEQVTGIESPNLGSLAHAPEHEPFVSGTNYVQQT